MSSGSHILAFLSKHWWLNCSTFALQSRPEEAYVTSLLNSICNFDFVVTIVIVQMCMAFKKGLSRSLDLD
jgi:hypothetical protein